MTLAGALLWVLLAALGALWLLLLAGAGSWGQGYGLDPGARPPAGVTVAVLVPARDEAGRIGPCVRAARAQAPPAAAVIVVDDGSSDGTADEAREAGAEVVPAPPRPAGWAGKPWACAEAARAAGDRADLLLFVDADVRLAPWAAGAAAARLLRDDVDYLSLFGRWDLRSFWERVVVPVVGWFIRGAVDLAEANAPTGPAGKAFANGQFLMVRRTAYAGVGGHGAVRAEVLDDVRMAAALRAAGSPGRLLHAPAAFEVRLYEALPDIVRGYGKNLFEGMGRRAGVAAGAALFIAVTTLLPWGLLAAPAPWRAAAAALCGLQVAFRWRLERADGRRWALAYALTHPLGNLVLVGIVLRSAFGGPARWKGREFVGGKAA